jgi:hypothetical protein
MKTYQNTTISLLVTTLLAGCSGSEQSDATATDAIDADRTVNATDADLAQIEFNTDAQNTAANVNPVAQANTTDNEQRNRRNDTRSPQGIPDDADTRRDNQRRNREQNRGNRFAVDNREVRSYDGSDNNRREDDWGSAFSQLQRLADANYSDDVSSMIFTDRAGARQISNTIVNQEPGENLPNAFGTSDFTWQWGQFIDHDLDLTDGSADEPQPIPVPSGDRYFDPAGTGTAVIPFNRAIYDPDTGYDAGNARQQENEITSWIDASMVYGSSAERAAALRVGPDSPLLATSSGNLLPFNTASLTNANGPVPDPTTLFLAGDIRANEQIGLASMHTLFVREHNRMAQLLRERDPDASAESIFQATRRLVSAQIQIITYNEFLPALIGPNAIPPYTGYDDDINPTIYNEFSAAAFRLGHSMVSDQLLRLDANGNAVDGGPLSLARAFFTAPSLLTADDDIDPILRGLASQTHQTIDTKVIHSLRNLLFGVPGSGGLDLTALNIQRGRDHGLPSYNDMRVAMGLPAVTAFSQIGDDPELQQSLQDAYGDLSKVDLWIGGLAETPLRERGSQLGELFQAILVKQFTDIRDGDRFWYQNDLNDDELELVENTTLAQVIRRNTGIGNELQDNVFYVNQ